MRIAFPNLRSNLNLASPLLPHFHKVSLALPSKSIFKFVTTSSLLKLFNSLFWKVFWSHPKHFTFSSEAVWVSPHCYSIKPNFTDLQGRMMKASINIFRLSFHRNISSPFFQEIIMKDFSNLSNFKFSCPNHPKNGWKIKYSIRLG